MMYKRKYQQLLLSCLVCKHYNFINITNANMDGCYGFEHSYDKKLDWFAILDTIKDSVNDGENRR